nr:hypothetical protein [Clostridium novyi]
MLNIATKHLPAFVVNPVLPPTHTALDSGMFFEIFPTVERNLESNTVPTSLFLFCGYPRIPLDNSTLEFF